MGINEDKKIIKMDTINSLQNLNILFQNLIIDMLGFEKTGSPAAYSEAAFKAVRVSWPTGGAPAWKVTDDVCFIKVSEEDDKYNRLRESKYENIIGDTENIASETWYTRVIGLSLVIYGPNSWSNAMLIRDSIFKYEYQTTLRDSNLHLIPDIMSPVRFPELFQTQWWERVDLAMKFNELVIREDTAPFIKSVDVIINTDLGVQKTVSIEQ